MRSRSLAPATSREQLLHWELLVPSRRQMMHQRLPKQTQYRLTSQLQSLSQEQSLRLYR